MLSGKSPTSNTNVDDYSVFSTGKTDRSQERVSSQKEFHEPMSNGEELGTHL